MAVTMSGALVLPADRTTVWQRLNDAATLQAAIPGCESLEKISDTEFRAVAKLKIGPVSARFKGKVHLSDIDPPNFSRISGEGEGGVAGFAKGGAAVTLADADAGATRLSYQVEAQVGGKIAQLGARLIDSSAKKLAAEFFDNFATTLGGAAAPG
jgi:carbon monoxide dehydrogenase subunit G